jgi:hypothetical protein
MPVSATNDQLMAVSTHVNRKLMRGENMGSFTTSLGDKWVDPLDPKIQNILKTVRKDLIQYTYVAGKSITTVSFELYGTTSAWWIILYLNGYMHPDEISDGATLKVPSEGAIMTLLQEAARNNRGREITI